MANGVTIEIKGLKELQKQLGKFPTAIVDEVDTELRIASNDFVERAVMAAPVDNGVLKGKITAKPIAKLQHEVVSGANYSAYVEWGTITQVKVPAELQAYAAQFKGKGIKKTGGMPARPFFFVQMPIIEKQLNASLNEAVKRAIG